MDKLISSILGYVKLFLMFLGITFLFDELWNWFQGDSLLRNAVTTTVALILLDLGRFLVKKFNLKKDSKKSE